MTFTRRRRTGMAMTLLAGIAFGAAWAASPRDAASKLRGRVTAGGEPVAEASVGRAGAADRVKTDREGRFVSPHATPGRVAASKPGFFIAGVDWSGQGDVHLELRAHPKDDCREYRWVSPTLEDARRTGGPINTEDLQPCAVCHEAIVREWSGSPHALSAVNRRFMNLYEGTDWDGNEDIGWSLRGERPEAAGVCASCHVPSLAPEVAVRSDLRKTSGIARQGIHCDFCHKIADVAVEQVGLSHGRFAIQLLRPPPGEQVFLGPLDDDGRGHSVHAPLYRRSRYCASCHEGTLLGTHAYGEYSEWLASPYARRGVECQDCHMKPTGRMTNLAPGHGGLERNPHTLASHGSSRGDAAVLGEHLGLDLQAKRSPGGIEAVARVEVRGVGHRMPTGYPDRALLLWVRATDSEGRPLGLLDGAILPPLAGSGRLEAGNLAGQPGRMYAKMLEGPEGQVPVPYWRPNRVACDTRLMPDESDRREWRFQPSEGAVVLEARLIYRRFSKALADEKRWPENEIVVATRKVTLPAAR